jgi:hypothetical protein
MGDMTVLEFRSTSSQASSWAKDGFEKMPTHRTIWTTWSDSGNEKMNEHNQMQI